MLKIASNTCEEKLLKVEIGGEENSIFKCLNKWLFNNANLFSALRFELKQLHRSQFSHKSIILLLKEIQTENVLYNMLLSTFFQWKI